MYHVDIIENGTRRTLTTDATTERKARQAFTRSMASTAGGVERIDWPSLTKPGAKPIELKRTRKPEAKKETTDVHD